MTITARLSCVKNDKFQIPIIDRREKIAAVFIIPINLSIFL